MDETGKWKLLYETWLFSAEMHDPLVYCGLNAQILHYMDHGPYWWSKVDVRAVCLSSKHKAPVGIYLPAFPYRKFEFKILLYNKYVHYENFVRRQNFKRFVSFYKVETINSYTYKMGEERFFLVCAYIYAPILS